MRIVSLLPSATEIVCEIGLADSLVGVTHECDWPPCVRSLPKVTNTLIPVDATSREIDQLVRERLETDRALYTLDFPTLESLKPDLIVTQALCDVCAVAEAEVQQAVCRLPGQPPVINLEPESLNEVLESVITVGRAAGAMNQAAAAHERLQSRVKAVAERSHRVLQRPRVVVLEWIDPPFSAGHWVPEIVSLAGGLEAIGRSGERSRTLAWGDVVAAQPEVLFISCCGYTIARTLEDMPLLKRQPGYDDLPCVRSGRVFVLDGSAYLSRPGPRLVDALELMAHAMHPDVHPPVAGSDDAIRAVARR